MKYRLLILIAILIFCAGCQRGDLKVTPVIKGQPAPHEGYNVGPELYLEKGVPAVVTGAVIYIKGLDPNNLEAGIQ